MLAVLALPLKGSIKICSVLSFLGAVPGLAGFAGSTFTGACVLGAVCCAPTTEANKICTTIKKINIFI